MNAAALDPTAMATASGVSVNGEPIAAADIAQEAQHHRAPPGQPELAWQGAARALVVRAVLLQEARRRGLEALPRTLGPGRRESDEEALIRALLEASITVDPPGEAEVYAAWARDPQRHRSAPLWQVSHILCAVDPARPDTAAPARQRAEALAGQLRDDPGAFGRLAGAHSDCTSGRNGGALGQLGPGDTVAEFERVLHDLSPGGITPAPVRSRFGWHLIRLDARAEGQPLPYETVRPRLAEALEKAAWARAARTFAAALLDSAEVRGVALCTDR